MQRKHKKCRARDGTAGAAVTAQGLAKARDSNRKYSRRARYPQPKPKRQHYSVADGRVTVGSVVPCGAHRWRAIAADGSEIGIFDNLQAAIRAVPFAREKKP